MIPTAVIGFNRYDELTRVVDALVYCPTDHISFFFDGPKTPSDAKIQDRLKLYIYDKLNGQIPYQIVNRETNLGLRENVVLSLTEFFSSNEFGVILEDDCVPSPDFYYFLKWVNLQFKNNRNVFCATGNRFPFLCKNSTVLLSRYVSVWGWATWNDRWFEFVEDLYNLLQQTNKTLSHKLYFYEKTYFELVNSRIQEKHIDSWAYLFQFKMFERKSLCIVPPWNMVQNIGFNENATHTIGLNPSLFSTPTSSQISRDTNFSAKSSKVFANLYNLEYFIRNHLNIHSIRDFIYVIRKLRHSK